MSHVVGKLIPSPNRLLYAIILASLSCQKGVQPGHEVWRCHQTPGVSHCHPTPGKLQLPNPSWVKVPRRPLFGRTLYRRVHSRRLHGGERTGLGRDGTGVQRVEVGVVPRGVPVAPASVPGAGPELLVRRERVSCTSSVGTPTASKHLLYS